MPITGTRWKEGRDLAIYLLVAVVFLGGIAILAGRPGLGRDEAFKWISFATLTALVFAETVRTRWRHRKAPRFWPLLELCACSAFLDS